VRAAGLPLERAEAAARRAKALGDPTRLAVAVALQEGGELCGCDLSWVVGRSQNLVSHHLRTLRSEGIVAARRDGRMVMFSLTPAGLALTAAVTLEEVTA
jgi:ArsR family transcriptional regulator, lead/cadmium/zinc/bismuth-responsive transcriptional repressor